MRIVSAAYGLVERLAVLGDDDLLEAVQVHRVRLQALVEVGDLDPVALVDHDRLGGREALAVQGEPDDAGVVEHHRDVLGDLQVGGDVDARDRLRRSAAATSPT